MPLAGAVQNPETLRDEDIVYDSDAGSIQAYAARPSMAGSYPGIVVIHEAFGPVEHMRDVARRLANIGFIAIAPNLYSREGQPKPDDMDDLMGKMFGQDDRQAVRDLNAAASWLRADPECSGKVGVIGFCSGGRMALLFACSSQQVDACVDCWGGFVHEATPGTRTTPSRPDAVIDLVPNLKCPLLAVGGAEDENPSPEDMTKLGDALQVAGVDARVKIFEGAGHAFFADYRPTYVEAAAHELWGDVTQFLDQNLR